MKLINIGTNIFVPQRLLEIWDTNCSSYQAPMLYLLESIKWENINYQVWLGKSIKENDFQNQYCDGTKIRLTVFIQSNFSFSFGLTNKIGHKAGMW